MKTRARNNSSKNQTANKKGKNNEKKKDTEENVAVDDSENHQPIVDVVNIETDISQIQTPTFTTISKQEPETMVKLNWDHDVNLIGEKVPNPMIHCCDTCQKPIITYGRLIPCKHVFCLSCATNEEKLCARCKVKVIRVEQTGLGSVFLCTFGGSTYNNSGCRRTYLSQRDLKAHIDHRHSSDNEGKISEKKLTKSTSNVPLVKSSSISASEAASKSKPTTATIGDPRISNNNKNKKNDISSPNTKIEHPLPQSQNLTQFQQISLQSTPPYSQSSILHRDQPAVVPSPVPPPTISQAHLRPQYQISSQQHHSAYINSPVNQSPLDYSTNSIQAQRINLITTRVDSETRMKTSFIEQSFPQNNNPEYRQLRNAYPTLICSQPHSQSSYYPPSPSPNFSSPPLTTQFPPSNHPLPTNITQITSQHSYPPRWQQQPYY